MAKDIILEAVLGGEPISPSELAAIPDFASIRKEIWEKFPGAIVRKTYKPGEILIRQGEYGTTAFFIVSGVISIFMNRPQSESARRAKPSLLKKLVRFADYLRGVPPSRWESSSRTHIPVDGPVDLPMENPIAEVQAGDLVGELAALAALKQERLKRPKFYPRSATVQAKTDVVVLEMLPHILNNVLYNAPAFKDRLNRNYRSRALETHLRSMPLFRNLSPEFLALLKELAELENYAPGQVIFRQGDPADSVYLVRLGFVKVSQVYPGGELVLSYQSRGSYFGEMALLPAAFRVLARGPKRDQIAEGIATKAPLTIGRAPGVPAALSTPWDEFISREHATVRVEQRNLLLERLPSGKNLITMGGQSIERALLSPGDSFQIGDTTFEVERDASQIGQRDITCTALDFVQLVRIRRAEFERLLKDFPEIAEEVNEVARVRRQLDRQQLGRVQQVSLGSFLDQDLMQGQNLLLLDLNKCTRCDECVKACVSTHQDGVTRLVRDGLRFENYLVPTSCRACLDPLCMTRCPVGSIRRKHTLDIVIEDWCIGCGNCASDCPYGNINVVEVADAGSKPELRPKAVVCDLCAEYEEPNCVRACPHDAALRVEARTFFARDLAGVQLAVAPAENAPVSAVTANLETKLYANAGELVAMLPVLKIVSGPMQGSTLQLRYPSTSFGRTTSNDYSFPNDSQMSRSQAVIVCNDGNFILRDLNSTNGTLVNGEPITEIQLHPGDVIEMGEMQIEFRVGAMK